jgi:multidrug efflux pump subunit AcrA (membrane-fusion protein)
MDASVSVVTAPLRIAITVATVTLVAAIVWAFFAQVTTSTTLQGTVVPPSGFISVTTPDEGFLISVAVRPGDDVKAQQTIATFQARSGPMVLRAPVDGSVAEVLSGPNSDLSRGEVVAILGPDSNARAFLAFPNATDVESIVPGQKAVVTVPGCPTYTTEVQAVLGLPATEEQVGRQLGVPGLASTLMDGDVGFPVRLPVPNDWCPTLSLGAFGSATVTTGSVPAISFLRP